MAALIEILKASTDKASPNNWQALEEHVQHVYQTLIELEGDRVIVARDVLVRGRDGADYQIDVYYEFELAGVGHRVAIECKNSKRPVERNDVLAFKSKIDDCFNLQGIIVSTNGFQSAAKKYANDNGIISLTLDELPSIGKLLGMKLESAAIPGENSIGQPFWTLYEINTFAPLGVNQGNELYAILFYSKNLAEKYLKLNNMENNWCVRGLEPRHLGTFILTVDAMNARYVIAAPQHMLGRHDGDFVFSVIDRSDLISTYYQGRPLPEEPQIMPSRR